MQGLLNHTVLDEAEELDGMYKQAFDRIINQVQLTASSTLANKLTAKDHCSNAS